jgi:perosamine synthetase
MGVIKLPQASLNFFKSNLDQIFETGSLAEGQWNKALAEFCQSYCKAKIAIPTVSNGSGLMALLQIHAKLNNRSKVLLQSNTMYGVKTLAKSAGLDVEASIKCSTKTLMPTINDVEEAIDQHGEHDSLVVLLSHIGGIVNPDIIEIAGYCKEKNIILLEDCAHSFGATLEGKHSGLFGDGGVYSFYATKAIPAGEGGVVVTNDEAVGNMLKDYVIYDRFNQKLDIGVNIRPSEVQALLIYSVVKQVEEIISNKSVIADSYAKTCSELSIPFLSQDDDRHRGNYYKFIVLAEKDAIETELPSLKTTTSKVYDYCLGESKSIVNCHACLPIWYGLDANIVSKVIKELKESKRS